MGHEVICNRPDNGLAAIEEFGAEHLRSGALILYTSQDSVLQLAAHVERVPATELYERLRGGAREAMTRRARRRAGDRAALHGRAGRLRAHGGAARLRAAPPARSYLEELEEAGGEVHGVGKIDDLFAGRRPHALAPGRDATRRRSTASSGCSRSSSRGLVFANLIETDQVYGHRKDVAGFAARCARSTRRLGRAARAPARGRPADRDRRSRRRPGPSGHRPHARVRAAAGGDGRDGASRGDGRALGAFATTARWRTSARRSCAG